MVSKLLLSLTLLVTPVVSVSAQAINEDFDTFQTEDKYLQDFNYLEEYSYRLSLGVPNDIDYTGEPYIFYAFPSYYNVVTDDDTFVNYYSNGNYNFFNNIISSGEFPAEIEINNYVGTETEFAFLALDYIGMNQVIEYDKTLKSNDITIYSAFYKFFTGLFPENVVAEYQGIFTFVVVAFLFFLVFGFVFYLFRIIRRLMGYR